MSFMLGGFADGLFSGSRAVFDLYNTYQGIKAERERRSFADQLEERVNKQGDAQAGSGNLDSSTPIDTTTDPSGTGAPAAPDPAPVVPATETKPPHAEKPADLSTLPHPESARPRHGIDHNTGSVDRDRSSQAARVTSATGGLGRPPAPSTAPAAPPPPVDDMGRVIPVDGTAAPASALPATPPAPAGSPKPAGFAAEAVDDMGRPIPGSSPFAAPARPPAAPPGQPPAGMTPYEPPSPYPARVPSPMDRFNPDAPAVAAPASALPPTPAAPRQPLLQVTPGGRYGWSRPPNAATSAASAPTPEAPPAEMGADGRPRLPGSASWVDQARQNYPPGAAPAAPTPATPATPAAAPQANAAPSLGSRILSALNPIGSAQAAPAAPAAGIPAGTSAPAAPAAKEEVLVGRAGSTAPQPGAPPRPASGKAPPKAAEAPAGATVVQAPPKGEEPPPAVADAQVTLPEVRANRVTPNQAGPSTQSEANPTMVRHPFDPRPSAWLAKNRPEDWTLVQQVAARNGVTPDRLAAHWYAESRLGQTSPNGAAGERGVMQVMPGTQREVDPDGRLDPSKKADSLEMGARYIRQMDNRFGQNSFSSFVAYNGGPGTANDAAHGVQSAATKKAVAYAAALHPGQKVGPADINGEIEVDVRGGIKAGLQGGPDGFLHFIAQSGNRAASMGDHWRSFEAAAVKMGFLQGGIDGARHAQDFVLQMSQQGTTASLMSAYQALAAGDGTTAAQQLARAHAFFPDGTMGRFGVDKSGAVWGQRVDEHNPGTALGKPFAVTPESLQAMFIQTRDPAKFAHMAQEQQKQASALRFQKQHGDYYGSLIGVRQDQLEETKHQHRVQEQGRADRLKEQQYQHDLQSQDRQDALAVRLETARGGAGGGGGVGSSPAAENRVDGEVGRLYGPGGKGAMNDAGEPMSSAQASVAATIHSELRSNLAQRTTMPEAHRIATGLVSGELQARVSGQDGRIGVFDKNATGGTAQAIISSPTYTRLMGLLNPTARTGLPMAQTQQTQPQTRGVSAPTPVSQSALPVRAGIPTPNAPSTTVVQ